MDCSALRKRNASDGDSGFDSALSSRSSSICLEDNPELNDLKISKVEESSSPPNLNQKFHQILDSNEIIFKDGVTDGLFIIRDCESGRETQYKPPGRVKFACSDTVEETYSKSEYNRAISVSKSHLFNSRLQLELEKQVAKMQLLEIDLLMDKNQSLGIRVIGVNMIHGVPDKINIYVKKIVPDSVAGKDGRIRPDDHIVEVNGVSLVGVSQKIASEALASCMVNPDTGFVNFVLARSPEQQKSASETLPEEAPSLTPEGGEPASPGGVQNPPAADNLLTDDCKVAEALLPHHSGTGEAFIPSVPTPALPCGDAAPTLTPPSSEGTTGEGAQAPTLSDLPLNVFELLASRYLSPTDSRSLAAVNKSFYHAVNKHKFCLAPLPPAGTAQHSKLLSAKNSLDIIGAKSSLSSSTTQEPPPANLTKQVAATDNQRRKILAAVARQSPVPCI